MLNHKISYSKRFTIIFEICLISTLISFITILRYVLYFLPNIELVTFFLLIFVLLFKNTFSFVLINSFCLVQIILFGQSDLFYFVIYNFYAIIIIVLRKNIFSYQYLLAILFFLFGILFGALYSFNYLIINNFNFKIMLAYYIKGIPFDLIHGIGNLLLFLFLYYPTQKIIKQFALNNTNLFNIKYLNNII